MRGYGSSHLDFNGLYSYVAVCLLSDYTTNDELFGMLNLVTVRDGDYGHAVTFQVNMMPISQASEELTFNQRIGSI